MSHRSTKIPKILQNRFDLIAELNQADKLLRDLEAAGNTAEAERNFLSARVEQMEKDLKATDAEVLDFLARFRDNNRLYICLALRYFAGLSWPEVAEMLHTNSNAAMAFAYRAFETRIF